MIRKYISIFFIFISSVILFAHNIFPHAHSEITKSETNHNHNGIGHLFDYYLHSGDSFLTPKVDYKIYPQVKDFTNNILTLGNIVNAIEYQYTSINSPVDLCFIDQTLYLSNNVLRGPPDFLS